METKKACFTSRPEEYDGKYKNRIFQPGLCHAYNDFIALRANFMGLPEIISQPSLQFIILLPLRHDNALPRLFFQFFFFVIS